MRWCEMCIILCVIFYEFIEGIMCIYKVFLKNLRPMSLYFTYYLAKIFVARRLSFLNKLASKVWKKNCPKFLYTLYEARRKLESRLSHSFLAVFPLLNKFVLKKKCLWVAGFLQSGALYATNTHDPRSENNQQKSEHSKCQRSWGVWGCF